MWYVYILQSLKDSRTYIGYTHNLEERLKIHNFGRVKATRYRCPFKLLYYEKRDSLKEVKHREKYWKSGSGRRRLEKYFKEGFPPIQIF